MLCSLRLSAAAGPSSTALNHETFEAFSAVKQAGCSRSHVLGERPVSPPFIHYQKGRCNLTAELLFFSFCFVLVFVY